MQLIQRPYRQIEAFFRKAFNLPSSRKFKRIVASLERFNRIRRASRGYGFVDWDVRSRKSHWQGELWSDLGYSDAEINFAAQPHKFGEIVHPEDADALYKDVTDLLRARGSGEFTFRFLKKDGSYLWVELRATVMCGADGKVSHLSGIIFDISQAKANEARLKENEKRLKRIMESSNDGIWEWSAEKQTTRLEFNEDGSIRWDSMGTEINFSSRCWEMLGYDEKDAVVKDDLLASWRALIHPDDGKAFDDILMSHVTQGTPYKMDYRIRGKQGDWRWIRVRGRMSYDEEGKPWIFSGTNSEITELKRAEEREIRAKEEAEKASQAKSEFLSNMSHELRTPLNAVLGFSQLIELDSNLTAQQKENVNEIKLAGQHLLELVSDVLDLAKIETGHLNLSMEAILPSRLINECVALLKAQCDKKGLKTRVNFNDLDKKTVFADRKRLKQVFLNLLSNAIKYNKKSGQVNVRFVLLDESTMRIEVEDSGVGIPEHRAHELFQPFSRLGAERGDVEGSGVGLVITRQLVEEMGGKIGFVSEEGRGSTFWLDFAIVTRTAVLVDEKMELKRQQLAEFSSAEEVPDLKFEDKKRVLYVEDNPSNQKLLEQVLAKYAQIDLTIKGSAIEGLFYARSTLPDLIILDVNLPELDGYEIVEVLKQAPNTQNIPVIALSANVLSHDVQKGLATGFDFYLTKPLNLAELFAVFNQLLSTEKV